MAARAESGRALQHMGCAYADLLAMQCEADMHRAVRRMQAHSEKDPHGI